MTTFAERPTIAAPRQGVQKTSRGSQFVKTITSTDFKGGKITCLMGGVQINLMHADFQDEITIDVACIMGGIELFVPSHWEIKNEISAILGGVSDQRTLFQAENESKRILHLKGTCVMGGVELKGA